MERSIYGRKEMTNAQEEYYTNKENNNRVV